jgi:hypothetical protein
MIVTLRAFAAAGLLALYGNCMVLAGELLPEPDAFRFGDDASAYALNGTCEDPRFVGRGVSEVDDAALMHDAKDCLTLFAAGEIDLGEEARSIRVDGPLDMIEILTRVGKGGGKAVDLN